MTTPIPYPLPPIVRRPWYTTNASDNGRRSLASRRDPWRVTSPFRSTTIPFRSTRFQSNDESNADDSRGTRTTQPLPDTPSPSPRPRLAHTQNSQSEVRIAAQNLQLAKQQLMERKNKKYLLELRKKPNHQRGFCSSNNTTIK